MVKAADCRLNCRISAHDSLLYVAVNQEFQGVIYYTFIYRNYLTKLSDSSH